jgi:hypothetical protein
MDKWNAFAKRTKCFKERFRKTRVHICFIIRPKYKNSLMGFRIFVGKDDDRHVELTRA